MKETNNTYRIKANVREDKFVNVNINQDYEYLEILSLKINSENFYKLHTSDYGCLVGRVLANKGVGIPNAKLSVFVPADTTDLSNPIYRYLYPYTNIMSKNSDGIRYNLLPDVVDDKCHQDVGTFPNKRLVLDDNNVIEIFDKYFKYTTVTNAAGDYMLFGLPVGDHIIHTELDLSDIGVLSQKPRDLFYQGYTKEQFENSSLFKKSTNLDSLTQIISQNNSVQVYPFWGDDEAEDVYGVDKQVKITRLDIDVTYKFEPTCIFIGSLVADDKSNGFSKRCIPTDRSGKMDRLTTGEGTIEMIRKTPDGSIESFSVQGNTLIDGNGTWCYQIPMNLDYVKTDEYGNLVPAEDEMTGIPTRARVRFRVSLSDYESDTASAHLPKLLIPNNPTLEALKKDGVDYNFGTYTRDDSFRDLMWNNVYSVKEYIPRIQSIILEGRHIDRSKNFSGIKAVNVNGNNNPIPYNNLRVQLTFLFIFQCIIFKSLVLITKTVNWVIWVTRLITSCNHQEFSYITLDGSMCPTMEGYYMALGAHSPNGETENSNRRNQAKRLISETIKIFVNKETGDIDTGGTTTITYDEKSSDYKYSDTGYTQAYDTDRNGVGVVVSADESYFVKCVELQFAMEYEVIQFDFYNDWINGMVYLPRWFAELKRKKRVDKVVACNEDYDGIRELVQQCSVYYDETGKLQQYNNGCGNNILGRGKCHQRSGRKFVRIFDNRQTATALKGGIIKSKKNIIDDRWLYYLQPCRLTNQIIVKNDSAFNGRYSLVNTANTSVGNQMKVNLFATDIILLGSVFDCDRNGLPSAAGYPSSTFIMPPPTGQILSDNQEMEILASKDTDYDAGDNDYFYKQNKQLPHIDVNDTGNIEMSGIDWGYNPFYNSLLVDSDNTTVIQNQRGGHFLEIGCMYSDTTPKSCINLQRICELGSEMSQTHFNTNGEVINQGNVTGVITYRDIVGEDLRTKFATLNSNRLQTVIDETTGYLKYRFLGYTPYQFDGAMAGYKVDTGESQTFITSLHENKSNSYETFRLCEDIKDVFTSEDLRLLNNVITKKCLITGEFIGHKYYTMPVYENSFYFYFGLKDGNTAIDRLYNEYFSECGSTIDETIDNENSGDYNG